MTEQENKNTKPLFTDEFCDAYIACADQDICSCDDIKINPANAVNLLPVLVYLGAEFKNLPHPSWIGICWGAAVSTSDDIPVGTLQIEGEGSVRTHKGFFFPSKLLEEPIWDKQRFAHIRGSFFHPNRKVIFEMESRP